MPLSLTFTCIQVSFCGQMDNRMRKLVRVFEDAGYNTFVRPMTYVTVCTILGGLTIGKHKNFAYMLLKPFVEPPNFPINVFK